MINENRVLLHAHLVTYYSGEFGALLQLLAHGPWLFFGGEWVYSTRVRIARVPSGSSGRFGMSLEEILKINPGLSDPDALAVGSSLCIVPNWRTVMAGNGQRICVA